MESNSNKDPQAPKSNSKQHKSTRVEKAKSVRTREREEATGWSRLQNGIVAQQADTRRFKKP